ncbi:MAG: glutamate formimidoyltransferase [Aggregatilineales bacterium]
MLVECVPNFSEGRRAHVVDQIVDAIAVVAGVSVLDRHSDPDHNRSVITFIGHPEAVLEAAYRGIAAAAQLIDMDQHSGQHPRIGAADVVPFVPVRGVTLADCAALAQRLGERVGRELGIPVYLYEAAALRPGRRALPDVRRGEYEGLKVAIATDPSRLPDYGPARIGPAGAVAVGARPLLVAFNVYLSTEDVEVARQIARAVRETSGGLPRVRALGMLVSGQAQVSMNLTDVSQTPLYRVFEAVRREAERRGVAVTRSEIVGMVAQQVLLDAARWYLQLDTFSPEQIIENRLGSLCCPE